MIREFNTDVIADVDALFEMHPPENRFPYERVRTTYGAADARAIGLTPVEEALDRVVTLEEVQSTIERAEREQRFPGYWLQKTWCPKGKRYSQNGLPYCWTWSGTGAMMTRRAVLGLPTVILSPVSGGKFIGWREAGNYLEDFINDARQIGLCEAINGNFNDTRNEASIWNQHDDQRKLYRLDGLVDCNNRAGDEAMLCQSLTCLENGLSGFGAWDWWGHAVEMVGWAWRPGEYLNVGSVLHNSHNEDDFIVLTGKRCIPSEFYGFGSVILTE